MSERGILENDTERAMKMQVKVSGKVSLHAARVFALHSVELSRLTPESARAAGLSALH